MVCDSHERDATQWILHRVAIVGEPVATMEYITLEYATLEYATADRAADGIPAANRWSPGSDRRGFQNFVEQCLRLALVGAFRQRQLTDQNLPRFRQHPLLAG